MLNPVRAKKYVNLLGKPQVTNGTVTQRISQEADAMELLALLILSQKFLPNELVKHEGSQNVRRDWLLQTLYPHLYKAAPERARDKMRYLLDKLDDELGLRPEKAEGRRERNVVELQLSHLDIDIESLFEAVKQIHTPSGRDKVIECSSHRLLENAQYAWLAQEPFQQLRRTLDLHYLRALDYKINGLLDRARIAETEMNAPRAADLRCECLVLLDQAFERKHFVDSVELTERFSELRRRALQSVSESARVETGATIVDLPSHNIPLSTDSFVGREEEIAKIKSLLTAHRSATLIGMGGCGKTRLAEEVARGLLADGWKEIWWIDLAALSDPSLVPQAIATVLKVTEKAGKSYTEMIVARLQHSSALLILDNCEHIIQTSAEIAELLLTSCPNVKILTTSRQRLKISGERLCQVSSLSFPALYEGDGEISPELAVAGDYKAIQLFSDRVKDHGDFSLDADNIRAVGKICALLDGIPLALELAAARVHLSSLDRVVEMLSNRFPLLTNDKPDAPHRHESTRVVIDWSYDLMTDQERALFCRLSVPPGGLTLEAARRIGACDDVAEYDVLDLLGGLVEKSIIKVDLTSAAARYQMAETLRQYGQDRLRELAKWSDCRIVHRDYFLSLAEEADAQLEGANAKRWLDRLEADIDNLRLALEWRADEIAMRLGCALQRFWHIRGRCTEGRDWLSRDWEEIQEFPVELITRSYISLGNLEHAQGDAQQAVSSYDHAIRLSSQIGSDNDVAKALCGRANAKTFLCKHSDADGDLADAFELFSKEGSESGIADVLHGQGIVAFNSSQNTLAQRKFDESLILHRKLGNKIKLAQLLLNMGMLSAYQEDFAFAKNCFMESFGLQRELENVPRMAQLLTSLGEVARLEGKLEEAEGLYSRALIQFRRVGDAWGTASAMNCLGLISLDRADYDKAEACFMESREIADEIGQVVHAAAMYANLGNVHARRGESDHARAMFNHALIELEKYEVWPWVASLFDEIGLLELQCGNYIAASRVLTAADTLYAQTESPRSRDDSERTGRAIAAIKTALGESDYCMLLDEARTWTRDQAMECVRGLTETSSDAPVAAA